jgi:hypothetical protein
MLTISYRAAHSCRRGAVVGRARWHQDRQWLCAGARADGGHFNHRHCHQPLEAITEPANVLPPERASSPFEALVALFTPAGDACATVLVVNWFVVAVPLSVSGPALVTDQREAGRAAAQ